MGAYVQGGAIVSRFSELAAEEEQARLDADEDRYSESKDEPPYPSQEWDDNKGDLICHQRREEP